ncbi:DUF1351 domain-containing protein [Listeria monocytogenes]|uniref:DUF1351 domain-containing protein n=1 Tax=Listeria monocytogenes TaxID=1639 RepID=UPI000E71710D|nr:DUF1351 domain-containing protein [Listeria monocytogenes]EAK9260711.1 DUF1351 domain-containing protein [Listeria monocytogenes]EFT8854441.1 DUF1351 domain-containing protein [Listeria monocytogenes]EFT8867275.1 DUF1351 domain-containing protein [Listeria monocytogenes]EFT8893445.1 DUF1351 domain-containing protein [Listeria monocytogenes]EFT8896484.1 DUF1351 domain-containing protein [Listeria monocytogenes]
MNTLPKIRIESPVVTQGSILFPAYKKIKSDSLLLAQQIENIEVTEENVKQSKKLLAAVNKEVKNLESERISIKKEMLEPYNEFEKQVKEIVYIVKTADEMVRQQVTQMEEEEREDKKLVLKRMFEKRIRMYDFKTYFTFDDFLENRHLNKSLSINKIENEMVEWLTKVENELKVIETMPYADEIIAEYKETKDLAVSAQLVSERHKAQEVIKEAKNDIKDDQLHSKTIFTLFDEKDAKLVEMFMQQNKIKFEKVEK